MDRLVASLRKDYPRLQFIAGTTSCWSPRDKHITYIGDGMPENVWGLFHEMGHALLQHDDYRTDIDLLNKEVLAWKKARQVAQRYKIKIEATYIEDCLDTYRDWLSKRSTCPTCKTKSFPRTSTQYVCFNCHTTWSVTLARHHRPYRRRM